MARAKRTDRADARRRYRADQAARASEAASDTDDADETSESGAVAGRRRPARGPARPPTSTTPAGRPGLLDGFRAALQPASIRADIAAAPEVLRSTRLLWIPFALVVLSGILAVVPGLIDYQIPAFLAQTFLFPPPLIGPFLAGLLAPRASWLFGGLTGVLSGLLFALFVATTQGAPVPGSPAITPDVRLGFIGYGLVTSPLFGALVGAFAGFYRRFLRSTTPQRPNANRSRRSGAASRRR